MRKPFVGWPTERQTLSNDNVIHWDMACHMEASIYRVPVSCGLCQKTRQVDATHISSPSRKHPFTGYCKSCNGKTINLHSTGPNHPAWKSGVFIADGYRNIQVSTLNERERELAEVMSHKFGNGTHIIAEHRLVMAVQLDRPLGRHDVVHHKNGNKLDNHPDNLELTSPAGHRQLDVKYYDLWQQALRRIHELENELLKFKHGQTD